MAQGRVYAVPFSAVAVSAAQDLFELTPADDKPVEIVGIVLGQTSDSGDAADEQLQISIIRGNTTSGSGGSAPTPAPVKSSATAASGFTAEVNNTTVASSGTAVTLFTDAWNVRAGYTQWFPEGAEPSASQTNTLLCVRMTAPADSITMSGTLFVRELG
jgi:hypothetical protein